MCHVETEENVAKGIRMSGELEEKRLKKIAVAFLVDISKVKIIICHRSVSGLAQPRDIINDCGATQQL